MKTIHKHPLMPGETSLWMPASAKVLDVGVQQGSPFLWVEVDTSEYGGSRQFHCVPTGGEVPEDGIYCGTAHGVGDWMVFHVYEVTA